MTAPETIRQGPVRTPANRVIQGLVFVAGAVVLEITVGAERTGFHWTPLILGVSYLVAAAIDGPRGGYWATAIGLTGWGLVVMLFFEIRPVDVDGAGTYLAGVGLAVVVAALLRSRGFQVSDVGLGVTIAAAGIVLALSPRVSELEDGTTYAIALGLVGLYNVAAGGIALSRDRRAAQPAR
ncbi:MAG: hypothetical protein H0V29_06165 [Thermoleophilaceae bacterium]|nr:hypothetical protein [Thermoleophilaceae bacterium]